MTSFSIEQIVATSTIRRGRVACLNENGWKCDTAFDAHLGTSVTMASTVTCDVLHTSNDPVDLRVGDTVVVAWTADDTDRGIVLGAIGQGVPRSRTDHSPSSPPAGPNINAPPETLVLEARVAHAPCR